MRRCCPLLLIAACSNPTIVVGELQEITSFPAMQNRDLDILFVVDNSQSMAPKQAALTASFPQMMDVLAQLDGGLPNLHIGVVTSDMGTSSSTAPPAPAFGQPDAGGCAGVGDDGLLQHENAPTLADAFISDVAATNGDRVRNYTGELRDVFTQIATVGEPGCGLEQHLAAMRRALANPANVGFLRPEANLAVVIIADEDDCSALTPGLFDQTDTMYGRLGSFRCTQYGIECDPDTLDTPGPKANCVPRKASPIIEDVQPFVDNLIAVKGDPRKVLVAGIVGDPAPIEITMGPEPNPLQLAETCGASLEVAADPAVRLTAFLDAFPGRSQFTSICSNDLTTPLAAIGNSAKKLIGDPCLDAVLFDSSAELPGLQPACEVFDVRDADPTLATPLPTCSGGAASCFEIVADEVACPTSPDHLRVRFTRTSAVEADTWTHVHCQVQRP